MESHVLFFFFFFFIIVVPRVDGLGHGFEVDLIHRDSAISPLFNHSATRGERSRQAALRSLYRVKHIMSTLEYDIESTVHQKNGTYLMRFAIGSPPTHTFGIIDTGSDLIWTQCAPCLDFYRQYTPMFDSKKSSTYKKVSCHSAPCGALLNYTSCAIASDECRYSYSYFDRSGSTGVLATDTLMFDAVDGQVEAVTDIVFGCGRDNQLKYPADGSGVIGLGGGNLSLISQLGSKLETKKFSYCLPSTDDFTSKLMFGMKATITERSAVSTPLLTDETMPTYYYLTLEGITIGDKKINNTVTAGKGNIIIDSGTTITYLRRDLYYDVLSAVKEVIGLEAVEDPLQDFNLCYPTKSFNHIPEQKFVFHFTGADVMLKNTNLFTLVEDLTCFAMNPIADLSIYGTFAQRNFQVEYNLERKHVSFAPADCAKYPQTGAGRRTYIHSFIFVFLIVLHLFNS